MFVVLFTNLLLGHRRAWPPLDIRPLAVIRHQCAVSGCHFTWSGSRPALAFL